MKQKYAFLLPSYKAQFFEQALRSIQNQTYKDFICIVSDDCSPENLKEIFDKVCSSDSRFTYRRNNVNMGSKSLVAHWNLLVDMCEADYFMMAGDDDIYHPTFLEEVDKLVRDYPEVGCIRARSQYIDSEGNVTKQDLLYPEYQSLLSYLYIRYSSIHVGGILNYALKRDVVKTEGQFIDFPAAWFSDDAVVMACSKRGICTTSDILTSMRLSGVNLSCQRNSAISRKKLEAVLQFFPWSRRLLLDSIYPSNSLETVQLEELLSQIRLFCFSMIYTYTSDISIWERIQTFRRMNKIEGFFPTAIQKRNSFVHIML